MTTSNTKIDGKDINHIYLIKQRKWISQKEQTSSYKSLSYTEANRSYYKHIDEMHL